MNSLTQDSDGSWCGVHKREIGHFYLQKKKSGDEKSGKTSWRRWLELNNRKRGINGLWKVKVWSSA